MESTDDFIIEEIKEESKNEESKQDLKHEKPDKVKRVDEVREIPEEALNKGEYDEYGFLWINDNGKFTSS